MKLSTILFTASIMALSSACKTEAPKGEANPLLESFNTPHQVPPFDKIKTEHYLPAFQVSIKEHDAEIEQICNSTDAATFANTVLAFDKSGNKLSRVRNIFFNLNETDTNDSMQSIAREVTPLLTNHADNIALNAKLFARIKQVYDNRLTSNLDSSQIRVTEKYYNDFKQRGALLSDSDQTILRGLNEKLSTLTLQYGENLLAETNKNFQLVIDNKEDLAGLPESVIESSAADAKDNNLEGKWLFTLQKPSWIPFLTYSTRRDLREKLYKGYYMRGDNNNANDNKKLVVEIVNLRAQKAKLLGYNNYAALVISDNMAKTTTNVTTFLEKVMPPALAVAKKERAEMQEMINKEGGKFQLASWDWWFYSEKLRKEKYDLDESQLTPYFKLENVREGMFWVANQLYGITFEKLTDLPVYNKETEVFEAKEKDGSHLGILYLDYHPRASKRAGAWQTDFRTAGATVTGERVTPVVSIVCNFTKPTATTPSLLTWDEVETLFHEFGHGLHALFTQGHYNRTAGVVPQDYVEMPSQIMENFCSEPQVMQHYAKHWQTGEAIPTELINKLNNSSQFNQGFATTEYLAAALLDMDWHTLTTADNIQDVNAFETKMMDKIGLIPEILPRYRSTYYSHIFDGGYAAGYYVYIWAEVLDADAFEAFVESGNIFNPELAAKFRKNCLQEVGEGEGMDQYRKFRGKDPVIEPLLKRRGLLN